ncbi:hypothetical protein [Mycobacterium paragordonae]|nr:hypothetical protein [Mycobacterium paragordonae]
MRRTSSTLTINASTLGGALPGLADVLGRQQAENAVIAQQKIKADLHVLAIAATFGRRSGTLAVDVTLSEVFNVVIHSPFTGLPRKPATAFVAGLRVRHGRMADGLMPAKFGVF